MADERSAWVRLKRFSDWGTTFYALALSGDRRHGIRVNSGENVRVRWPDGSETETTIVKRTVDTSYSDMGHSYECSSEEIGVAARVHGIEMFVPIQEVEVPAEWVNARTHG
jgi:hypothetical protein